MIAANRELMTTDAQRSLSAQAGMASLQVKDLSQSIFQMIEYVLGGRSEKEAREHEGKSRTFQEVQKNVQAYGDSQFLNEALYENYLDMFRYYDDDFE